MEVSSSRAYLLSGRLGKGEDRVDESTAGLLVSSNDLIS